MNLPQIPIHLTATIPEELAGLRLDQAIAELFPDYSRSRLQTWIRQQQVLVNGQLLRPRDRVHGGEFITITASIEAKDQWQAQVLALDIIYEDDAIIIINKPVGMVVHPAAGNYDGTLVNALLHHVPELAHLPRAGIVHRLDKDTSGLLVVAKTIAAHTQLIKQLQARTMTREYEAVVVGNLIAGDTIDEPIGRHPVHRKRMAVTSTGKTAVTHFRVIEKFPAHTRIKVRLETGRTHQIRVHMAHIRHPLVGDATYSGRLVIPPGASELLKETLRNFKHQALHAQRLGLIHPTSGKCIEWSTPVPDDMKQLITILRQENLNSLDDDEDDFDVEVIYDD